MAYSSVADVRNALAPGGAKTGSGTAANLDDAQIQDAINQADSMIDQYLSKLYVVPMADVPDPLPEGWEPTAAMPVRFWSRDIAAYLATLTYKRNQDVPPDEPARLRYELVLVQLAAVRDGRATLPFPPPTPPSGDPIAYVFNQYDGRLFASQDFNLVKAPFDALDRGRIWPGY